MEMVTVSPFRQVRSSTQQPRACRRGSTAEGASPFTRTVTLSHQRGVRNWKAKGAGAGTEKVSFTSPSVG